MQKSVYSVTKMDCSAEEQLVRIKLGELEQVRQLTFDLPQRRLTVYHDGSEKPVTENLISLDLDTTLIDSVPDELPAPPSLNDAKLLWIALAINFALFAVEAAAGLVARSMGLLADSLDMLADAIVYGLSLYAVARTTNVKKKVAAVSGYFQVTLAIAGLIEVVRRFAGYEPLPGFRTMIGISCLALIGNAVCLYLLKGSGSKEAHMRASIIFTSNDVIVNIGVMLAGAGVYFTSSKYPDLIVGAIVFVLVTRGALRILRLAS